jgi:voltage-gated potassium channel
VNRRRLEALQDRGWQVLNGSKIRTRTSIVLNWFLIILIFLNVVAVTLETVSSLRLEFKQLFWIFEAASVLIFSAEYLVRLWCVPAGPRVTLRRLEEARLQGDPEEIEARQAEHEEETGSRLRWVLSPMALVDLFAILPTFLPVLGLDMRFLRALRLLRVFRLLKVARYTRSIRVFQQVLREKREELILSFFVMLLCLMISSSLMYFVEHDVKAHRDSGAFQSIPAAMWWATAALSTVGYGDVYPLTTLGKILGAIVAMVGIGMFGLPAGILASGFMEGIDRKNAAAATKASERSPQPQPTSEVAMGVATSVITSPSPPAPTAAGVCCPHCGGGISLVAGAAG